MYIIYINKLGKTVRLLLGHNLYKTYKYVHNLIPYVYDLFFPQNNVFSRLYYNAKKDIGLNLVSTTEKCGVFTLSIR